MRKTFLIALAFALGAAGAANAQPLVVGADIVSDTVWGDNLPLESEIVLQQPIFVKSGATLTILPGVIVRGQPRSAGVIAGQVLGSPGALIVTQDGKIDAQGTRTAPIIWTTAAVDNDNNGCADDVDPPIGFEDEWVPGDAFLDDAPKTAPLAPLCKATGNANVGLWGGIAILGNAPTNLADVAGVGFGRGIVEGLVVPGFPVSDTIYGGPWTHESSGRFRFNSIRHGGDELGASNELNGLTLAGVGDGTIVEFNEVYANFDDGFEWFGGTVDGNNLVVTMVGDDSFDTDQGYTGLNQFLFTVQNWFNGYDGTNFGAESGDQVAELDGDDCDVSNNCNLAGPDSINAAVSPAPWPLSNTFLYNLTAIGSTPDSGAPGSAVDFPANAICTGAATPYACCTGPGSGTCAAGANGGPEMRNGFAGEVKNSIVVNTGTVAGLVGGAGGAVGWTVAENAAADYDGDGDGDLAVAYCSTFDDGAALNATATAVAANGDNREAGTGSNNNFGAGFNGLVEEDQTFNPTGNVPGKLDATLVGGNGVLNPRPANAISGIAGCSQPTETGTDPAATYRGAFIRTAAELWTIDWTVLNLSGLMAD